MDGRNQVIAKPLVFLVEPFQVSLIELDLDETSLIANLHDILNMQDKDDYISSVFMHDFGIIRG